MDKKEYIVSQLARTKNKKYELYVVTRLVHLLDDLNLKFVTQQYVYRQEGHALTDLYFPQLNLHVEVDEAQHKLKEHVEADKVRARDIINATGSEPERFDVTKPLSEINEDIDNLISKIRNKVMSLKESGGFSEWDYEGEMSSKTYVEKGSMDARNDVKFRFIKDACNCFGYSQKICQRGYLRHPFEKNTHLWFPLLNPVQGKDTLSGEWNNKISQDEETVTTRPFDEEHNKTLLLEVKETDPAALPKRIIFVKVRDNLGATFYRFRGLYELSVRKSLKNHCETWVRTSTCVNTYPPRS